MATREIKRCKSCDASMIADPDYCPCRKLTEFHAGQAVKLADTVRHPEFRGLVGMVKRTVKSRNVVTVEVKQSGFYKTYDAIPNNVIPL